MVILHRAWLVSSRKGVKLAFSVDFASILTVCHSISLNNNISPRAVSLTLVILKSFLFHVGVLDSATILETCNEIYIIVSALKMFLSN
jgi:hypothetical protein